MSRHTITVRSLDNEHRLDPAGTIGYDRMLRTYFVQGFPKPNEDAEHALWIGCWLEEFPTLASLYEGAAAEGYAIEGVSDEMAAAMAREASMPAEPSAAERFGLVR
ncbi:MULTISPECIES: hypothetical protein [Xanthomonas]|uniref:hypothetical protein n=1 Tax=Xanthomonas TaxID=338 RepID=UPI0019D71669|nr:MULTISPECIES: hypothetical protein [Xanthomonas]MCT8308711.1 hypothetical protein [Xanthomonas translucens pv. translucens]QSQ54787.1 hypothetical protein ISN36_19545 [Xanthomonas translucens pv. undulosa]QSQ62272.1 hypothetical protein ISN38_19860 [Xanthomonas translucens pv. undulosa]WCI07365.1 hypothetical protein PML25_23045 [Xanthomonas hortorum pv. pelargonii]WIH07097.1 hypothetical protein KHF85_20155 [Xanthomonas translucens pv. graminis]